MLASLSELTPVVLHSIVLYLFVIVVLRLFARRQTSGLTAVELAIVMLLGSAVETAMVAGNVSLLAGLVSAGTLLATNRALSLLMEHSRWLRETFVGRPVLLYYQGHFLPSHLRSLGLTEDDVREGIRERGYTNLDQVRLAVREIDGSISVVPKDAPEVDEERSS